MGWNSWNTFGKDINEALVREMADVIVDKGLKDAGYEYVVIDDCWSESERDPVTRRIVPDRNKFPSGMKALADYIHSKGLKFGIYSCAGVRTCADYPGSLDHEFLDAKTFAEWGVDFLKYDFCFKPPHEYGPLLYRRMGNALRASGREILFSACNWGKDNVWSWIRSAGAHMYRSTGDIFDNFKSMTDIVRSQIHCTETIDLNTTPEVRAAIVRAAGGSAAHAPGCWNDFDMLTVGMFGKGNVGSTGCDATDYKTHFALWCFFGSPLMLGCDIRTLDDEMLKLITNKELLALNKDPEFRPAFKVDGEDGIIYARLLADGDIALGFFNHYDGEAVSRMYAEQLGFPASSGMQLRLTDFLTGEDYGILHEHFVMKLPKHECLILRARPEPIDA